MGQAKVNASRRELHARFIIDTFEKFIDANISAALRQHVPECTSPSFDCFELGNAREALVKALTQPVPPSE